MAIFTRSVFKYSFILILELILLIFSVTAGLANNDFIVTNLRTDLSDVYIANDYRAWLAAIDKPTGSYPTYTTVWLSVDLADSPDPYGDLFSQVGLLTDDRGLYWFVYAEPGVECLSGEYTWWNNDLGKYLGCKGGAEQFVAYNTLHRVELVTYGNGFWIARIVDSNGISHDVAKILSDSAYIYAATVTMEEAYTQTQDPHLPGRFYAFRPQYFNHNEGVFRDWPFSLGNNINHLYATPSNICPQYYGATVNYADDPRFWYAGTGGNICDWIMFPPFRDYLPLTIKD
jgi:hypothetical protein